MKTGLEVGRDCPIPRRMNDLREQHADTVIRSLVDHATIKVWSYLATIFGDLAGEQGDEISGVVLSALTDRVGIRPEAMRVALHRLRKDEWIVARKAGRKSMYRLSEQGLSETQRASSRIYAREIERPDLWHLLVTNPASNDLPASMKALLEREDYLKISGNILLGAGPCQSFPDDVMAMEFTRMTVPPWLLLNEVSEESTDTYGRTAELLSGATDALDSVDALPALDRATIRLLAIHHWRRAVLRHSPLIDMLHGDAWSGAACRAAISKILDSLPRPVPETLIGDLQSAD